jgi:predicted SnoaL-like aldol condensation-catalyzing enzyme
VNGGSGGSGGAMACSAELSRANRVLVAKAIDELFVQKDITAADRYWSDPYYQHNPIAKSGFSTFRSLMSSIVSSASFSYQRLLTLAECELAVVYGRYSQTGVIFDMFRVRDGKIIEHWDSDTNQASETAHLGALEESAAAAANRALFSDFAAQVLLAGATAQASTFLSSTYTEHHGSPATGVNALTTFLAAENVSYSKVHQVIADGNFVFALSEGKRGSAAFGFYDLFRVEAGKLAEHWDSRRSVPSTTMSGLGIF